VVKTDFNVWDYTTCLCVNIHSCTLICLVYSEDLSFIYLYGSRVKNKRIRIVPVPSYVRKELKRREPHLNIFTNKEEPFNESYFSNVWRRFKQANSVEEGVTLYTFRYTAAIDIYTRTGSLSKLQKAMGHSNIMVSLTYLIGLDVAELKEEDLPMI